MTSSFFSRSQMFSMMQSIKKKENFLEPNDNCDVALHVTHKSFLSISSSVFPYSLSFFQIKTSQPFIILMGHAQRARNLRIPLFIPSKLFGYIAWECVIISNVIFSYHPKFYFIPSKIPSSNQFYLWKALICIGGHNLVKVYERF